jgi:hypothetical protein
VSCKEQAAEEFMREYNAEVAAAIAEVRQLIKTNEEKDWIRNE